MPPVAGFPNGTIETEPLRGACVELAWMIHEGMEFLTQHPGTAGFAAEWLDARQDPTHSCLEMVRSRVFGILAGDEDPKDPDSPRQDPMNRRREADPLGEGYACTWRMRVIKVAACVQVTSRRIRIFLSDTWPFLHHFHDLSQVLLDGA